MTQAAAAAPAGRAGTLKGLVLRVDGKEYGGWIAIRVKRDIQAAAAEFACEVTEAWPGLENPWKIKPGAPCEVLLEGELVITGHIDVYAPAFDGRQHRVELRGRSKTADFVDGAAMVEGGQFKGMTLGQITESLAKPFGLKVRTSGSVPTGDKLPDVQLQQGESAHAVVERVSRMQEVLVRDDAAGNLVLARPGAGRAGSPLVQGKNILAGRAELDASQQFSEVVVKAQRPNLDDRPDWDGEDGNGDGVGGAVARSDRSGAPSTGASTIDESALERLLGGDGDTGVSVSGKALDKSVGRYRPLLIFGEQQMTAAQAAQRAAWEVRRRAGQALRATIIVAGWRQSNGALWDVDLNVAVTSPWLGIDRELLISAVEFQADEGGTRTELTMTLADAFLPTAAEARRAEKPASGQGKDTETKADFWKAALSTVTGS